MATKKETPKKPAAKKAAATKKTATAKKTVAKKVEKLVEQTAPEHIGLVRNDSWLEPFEGAIRGRHDPQTLLLAICISVFTSWLKAGCSVSGHLTLRTSI